MSETLPKTPFVLFYQLNAKISHDPNKLIKDRFDAMPTEWKASWSLQDVNQVYSKPWFALLGIKAAPCVWNNATKTKHVGPEAFNLLDNFEKSKEPKAKAASVAVVPVASFNNLQHAQHHNYATLDQLNEIKRKLDHSQLQISSMQKLIVQMASQMGLNSKKINKILKTSSSEQQPSTSSSNSSSLGVTTSTFNGRSGDDDLMTRVFDMVSRKTVSKKPAPKEEAKKVSDLDTISQKSDSVRQNSNFNVHVTDDEGSGSEEEQGNGFTSQFEEDTLV